MLFKPIKQSEFSALGNHTDYRIIGDDGWNDRILIVCTCHPTNHKIQDMRWIERKQEILAK